MYLWRVALLIVLDDVSNELWSNCGLSNRLPNLVSLLCGCVEERFQLLHDDFDAKR